MSFVRKIARKVLFPGFDIHTRARAMLCKYWDVKDKIVLDAGCGNGYFVKLAVTHGAKKAIGISFDDANTKKANDFFKAEVEKGIMDFKTINIYQIDKFFDQNSIDTIVCYETIEHLMDDNAAIRSFYRILKPGGVLHLCTPNKKHFEHANITPSVTEDGWHVRKGYDEADYTTILQGAGFKIDHFAGVGNNTTYQTDKVVRTVRHYSHVLAFPFFVVASIINKFKGYECPVETAFSIYARAIK